MESLLHNPVYNALCSGDSSKSLGTDKVKFFDKEVSPFAGFDMSYVNGFADLHELLPDERKILYAEPQEIDIPKGWRLLAHVAGLQFVLHTYKFRGLHSTQIVPLGTQHVAEMISLTNLTKPGPFDARTIEFGSYFGIFQDNRLAAMTGQRLHVYDFTEISAVCTHPDFLGRGFAGDLLHHQIDVIRKKQQTPFLHVRADNKRAIDLYKRIGFTESRTMHFYFMQKTTVT